MKKALIVSSAVLFVLAGSGPAAACALAPQYGLQISDEAPPRDAPPPESPTLSIEFLHRGEAVEEESGEVSGDSCDDTGFFRFKIAPDRPELGYQFNVRSGTLPEGYSFPQEPVQSNLGGPYWTDYWADGATHAQESFRFELEVVAVDKWGRTSEPSNTLVVEDPGRGVSSGGAQSGGCNSSPARPSPYGIALGLLFCAFGWSRRIEVDSISINRGAT